MPEWTEIAARCDRIVAGFQPEQIVLFGAYAYGTPTADSDVELLVLLPYAGCASSMAIASPVSRCAASGAGRARRAARRRTGCRP